MMERKWQEKIIMKKKIKKKVQGGKKAARQRVG